MAIDTTTNKTIQECNGALTGFVFTFPITSANDLQVIMTYESTGVEQTLALTTDYTVTPSSNDYADGGTVTTVATWSSDYTITIHRSMDFLQSSDFTENMPTLYETFENGLDKLTMEAQQLNESANRAIRIKKSDVAASLELPLKADRASKYLAFDATGEITTLTGDPIDFSDVIGLANSYFPDYLAADQGLTGASNTAKYYQDTIGTTNKATIYFRHNSGSEYTDYAFGTNETISSNITLIFERGARLAIATGITVTINSPFDAGLQQVFSCTGTGKVVFGAGSINEVYPEWWRGDSATNDAPYIQAAINTTLPVKISNSYTTTETLTVFNNTKILGNGYATINHVYSPLSLYAIHDATTQTASISNVVLKDFNIVGDSENEAVGNTVGVFLANVNNSLIENVNVSGFSTTGIVPCCAVAGGGGVGARNNKVINSNVSAIGRGDAFAFTGYDTQFIGCKASDFFDTAFAVIPDHFSISTAGRAIGATFDRCDVIGKLTGTPLGFGFGPFAVDFYANMNLINCTVTDCYMGLWAVAFDGLFINNCKFYSHRATDTGNVRLDGIKRYHIKGGIIEGSKTGAGYADHVACVLLDAFRTTYGVDVFDLAIDQGFIGDGVIIDSSLHAGIVAFVGGTVAAPAFTPTCNNLNINGAIFKGTDLAIFLKPNVSEADMYNNILISNNSKKEGSFLAANGVATCFKNINVVRNNLAPAVTYKIAYPQFNVSSYEFKYDLGFVTATTAQLADKTHAINTLDKYVTKPVFNSTTEKFVFAQGYEDTDVWNDAVGALAHTPI